MSKFLKSFLCIFACVFLCVASFFTGYFFRDTVKFQQSSSLSSVSLLDTSNPNYSFTSSNIYVLFTAFPSDTETPYEYQMSIGPFPVLSQFNLSSDNSFFSLRGSNHFISNYVYDTWVKFDFLDGPADVQRKVFAIYYIDSGFNFNVTHFTYGTDSSYYGDTRFRTTLVMFYDNNGKSFGFQFCYYSNNYDIHNLLDRRTYYYLPNFSDTDMYNQGYGVGYNNGLTSGEQQGYNNGYNVGYQDGELNGYNNGLNTTNTYSFSNLLTAVVEAPVNVFINLLDFNIMGYNLLSLVVGLLSLAVIVVIIKLCLGGK